MNHIRLLTDKSDVNYQDQYGFSAVHYAVMTRNKEALLHIIENGAKVSIESKVSLAFPINFSQISFYAELF